VDGVKIEFNCLINVNRSERLYRWGDSNDRKARCTIKAGDNRNGLTARGGP